MTEKTTPTAAVTCVESKGGSVHGAGVIAKGVGVNPKMPCKILNDASANGENLGAMATTSAKPRPIFQITAVRPMYDAPVAAEVIPSCMALQAKCAAKIHFIIKKRIAPDKATKIVVRITLPKAPKKSDRLVSLHHGF